MKKIAAILLTATALTAHAQSRDDAVMMARCSAEFTASASLLGEQHPGFNSLMEKSGTSYRISYRMYQGIGANPELAANESKAWIKTLTRQFAQDPSYVRNYLVSEARECSQHNVRYKALSN